MTSPNVIVHSAEEARRIPYRLAREDLWRGAKLVELWGAMAWFDVRQRYARSTIGPFWLTLSLGLYTGAIAFIYGSLFKTPLPDLLAYLSVGMAIWTYCLAIILEGASVFVFAEVAIKQMPAPLCVHVYRLVWRTLIMLAHNALVPALVLLWAGPWAALAGLPEAALGMAILIVNSVAVALALGTLGARFRDLPPFLTNLTSLLFFVTPIFWRAEQLGDRIWVAWANPMYHFIELVRAPLLGGHASAGTWAFALAFTVLDVAAAFFVYARFRVRIPYWI
ncbi:ABC transporter permease [Enterovirga sp.]|uniref:ABC transporter permease n=1 Tax=Enterovirga sp. TaxID=2026350 RepID=UPI002CAC23C1|nr:ABC transporter permease [Enterovirga sp.]HMO30597.1 ABC transporter permease [Enterovirga sp.]